MSGWRAVHVGFEEDDFEISGVKIWQEKWRRTEHDPITLPHPSYQHQLHSFTIYEIGSVNNPVRFAASELSNLVWGFYVPK